MQNFRTQQSISNVTFIYLFYDYFIEAMTEMLRCEEKQRQYEMEKENMTAKIQNE